MRTSQSSTAHSYPEFDGVRVTRLLQPGDGNTKLRKNGPEILTAGLSLAPEKQSGVGNTCPHASPGCSAACLDHQGLASVFQTIRRARIAKTRFFYADRPAFLEMLRTDLRRFQRKAEREQKKLAVRLNVFSDIAWERHIIGEFPDIQFYDYTKNAGRVPQGISNYQLTFSRSELNEADCLSVLQKAGNVAVVFADMEHNYVANRSGLQRLPKTWRGYHVVDGDISDLRFQDPVGRTRGRVIGLRLKAHSSQERRQAIESGFAVPVR
jgi:hypothetical protein